MMMNILRKISGLKAINFIFATFIAVVIGMLFAYISNSNKVKQLQMAQAVIQAENKRLKAQNEELADQVDVQIKKGRELSNELLQLSEEKSECYKKIIRYNQKLKSTSIKAPNRVEHLVNNHFSRVFSDIAKATGA